MMGDLADDFAAHIDTLQKEFRRGLSDTSVNKFRELEAWLEDVLELLPGSVTAKYIGNAKNLGNRIGEIPRRNPAARLGCLLVPNNLVEAARESALGFLAQQRGAFEVVTLASNVSGSWKPVAVLATEGSELGASVHAWFESSEFEETPTIGLPQATADIPLLVPAFDLVIDPRVRRMVRLALASSPGLLLVGPPGTGKTSILREVVSELQSDPNKFGFTRPPKAPKWVTPEESWTTRELIGGETIDDQSRLRFRPGHLLEAIRNDQWLILDEANRADMDKIFGGLMTWLAGQPVELGRASTALESPSVTLSWTTSPDCQVIDIDELEAKTHEEDAEVSFLAGTEWRLLGTYNALDAQRVFRFGQALGRRFVRVPIPALSPQDFERAIQPRLEGLPERVGKALIALYAAHFESSATTLGPAIFMRAEAYIRRGLELPGIGMLEGQMPPHDEGLIAEAYLTAAGTWLAKLESEELEALGSRVRDNVFSTAEWEWIVSLLPALA